MSHTYSLATANLAVAQKILFQPCQPLWRVRTRQSGKPCNEGLSGSKSASTARVHVTDGRSQGL